MPVRLDHYQNIVGVHWNNGIPEYIELATQFWESRTTGPSSADFGTFTGLGVSPPGSSEFHKGKLLSVTFELVDSYVATPVQVRSFYNSSGQTMGFDPEDEALVMSSGPAFPFSVSGAGSDIFAYGFSMFRTGPLSDFGGDFGGGYDPEWNRDGQGDAVPNLPGVLASLGYTGGPPSFAVYAVIASGVEDEYNPTFPTPQAGSYPKTIPVACVVQSNFFGSKSLPMGAVSFDGISYTVIGYRVVTGTPGPKWTFITLCKRDN